MFRTVRIVLGSGLVSVALVGFIGCSPKTDSAPPASDAVTTEPLDIQLPADNQAAPAAEPSEQATETPSSKPVAESPKL